MQPNEAYPAEQNLPTRRSASGPCNERFRQQHTFPFPQQSCSLPTGHRGLDQASLHEPKNHAQTPKGQELLETAVPLRLVWESNISHQWKERKKRKQTKKKTQNQKTVERREKPGLGETAGEINLVSLQWGAVALPALILNRRTRLHSSKEWRSSKEI